MNIAEILKDKKVGTKLYSPILAECFLKKVDIKLYFPIVVECKNDNSPLKDSFSQDGHYFDIPLSECLIFPSKHMREWSSFAWKKGDVLANQTETKIVLFDGFTTNEYTYFKGKYCYSTRLHDYINDKNSHVQLFTNLYHKMNSEDAKKYIKILKGKLNMGTLKIKPSKCNFKPFDKVIGRTDSGYWRIDFFEFYNIDNKYAPYQCMNDAYKECLPYNDKTAKLISTCKDNLQN